MDWNSLEKKYGETPKKKTGGSLDALEEKYKGNQEKTNSMADMLLNKTPAGKLAQRTLQRTILAEPINERQFDMVKHRGRGFKQMVMKGAKELGYVSQEDFDDYTNSALEKREKFEKDFLEKYGDSEFWDQVDFETDIGTSVALPTLGGKSRAARILFGALVGGAEQGSRLTENEEDIGKNFATGAALGGAASGAVELLDSLRPSQLAKRAYKDYVDSDTAGQPFLPKKKIVKPGVVKEGQKLEDLMGEQLTASEITQDPFLQALEQFVRADPSTEAKARLLSNKQIRRSFKWFKGKANAFDGANAKNTFPTRMKADFDATLNQLTRVRKYVAGKNFNAAFEANNGAKVIDTQNIKAALSKEISDLSQSGVAVGKQKTKLKELISIRDSLDDKITAKNAQALYESWSPNSGIESKVFKELDAASEKRILKGLTRELDDAVDASGDTLLIKARDNYRVNSAPIQELREAGVGKLFGTGDPSPEQIIKAFDGMNATDIKSSISLLKRKDPKIVDRLKAFKINQALEAGRATRDPGMAQFDLAKFQAKMKDDAFDTVFDAKERSDILKGLNYVNRINKSINKMTSTQQIEAGGFVNKTIMAKIMGRFVGAKGLGNLLFTPEGLALLKKGATAPNTTALSASLMDLVEYDKLNPIEALDGASKSWDDLFSGEEN